VDRAEHGFKAAAVLPGVLPQGAGPGEWLLPLFNPVPMKPVPRTRHAFLSQGSPVLLNISEGSTSLSILGASLASSQHYQVKVRSLVVPIHYEGIPSDWTHPVDWTSQEGTSFKHVQSSNLKKQISSISCRNYIIAFYLCPELNDMGQQVIIIHIMSDY